MKMRASFDQESPAQNSSPGLVFAVNAHPIGVTLNVARLKTQEVIFSPICLDWPTLPELYSENISIHKDR